MHLRFSLPLCRKDRKPINVATCDAVNDFSKRENKNGATDTLNRKRKSCTINYTIREYMHKNEHSQMTYISYVELA